MHKHTHIHIHMHAICLTAGYAAIEDFTSHSSYMHRKCGNFMVIRMVIKWCSKKVMLTCAMLRHLFSLYAWMRTMLTGYRMSKTNSNHIINIRHRIRQNKHTHKHMAYMKCFVSRGHISSHCVLSVKSAQRIVKQKHAAQVTAFAHMKCNYTSSNVLEKIFSLHFTHKGAH